MTGLSQKRGVLHPSSGRKAQITVFMIVGIILLFSSALLFYIRGQIVEGIPEEFVPTVEEVPLEAQPVKLFVEDCMKQVASEGVRKMGAHSGYVDPSDPSYGSMFRAGISPTESDALRVMEGSDALVPYWWHMSSPNNCMGDCVFQSGRPALYRKDQGERSIEGQLDTYLENNLPGCIDDFRIFREQGFEIEVKGELDPEFRVAETESLVLLDYPITISKEGRTIDVGQFFTKLDVNIKNMYELAGDIADFEVGTHFLESHALDLISMYSSPVGTDRLPPVSHFTFGVGEYLVWTRTETQERLESYVLPPGISMLQVLGTANDLRHVVFDPETEEYDAISTGMLDKTHVMLNTTRTYPSVEARMAYLDWWPVYLNINDVEILRPREIGPAFTGPLFDMLGMSEYYFLYDLSFPVLVTLSDPFAFNGKGFKFTFAMEANIRDNQAMDTSFLRLPTPAAETYFCDPDHRNSGPVRVEVSEMYTGDPVLGARVDFIAGDEMCFIGFTELDDQGRAVVSADFPVGFGEIRIADDDYLPVREEFSAFLDEGGNYSYRMMPLYTIDAVVKPVPLNYHGGGTYVLPQVVPEASLDPRENALILLRRQDDDGFGGFETALSYNVTGGPSEMIIAPGTYEVQGTLMLYRDIRIPKETKTVSVPFKDDVTVTVNATGFDEWQSGGVVFNNKTGYLDIKRSDIMESRLVRFKVLRFPLPVTHSSELGAGPDLNQIAKHEDYSNIYKHELQPEWIR